MNNGGECRKACGPGARRTSPSRAWCGRGTGFCKARGVGAAPRNGHEPVKAFGYENERTQAPGSFSWDSTGQSPLALVGAGGGFALYWIWGKGGDRKKQMGKEGGAG